MIADLGMTADADDAEIARTAATDTSENFMFDVGNVLLRLLIWGRGRKEEDSMPSILVNKCACEARDRAVMSARQIMASRQRL